MRLVCRFAIYIYTKIIICLRLEIFFFFCIYFFCKLIIILLYALKHERKIYNNNILNNNILNNNILDFKHRRYNVWQLASGNQNRNCRYIYIHREIIDYFRRSVSKVNFLSLSMYSCLTIIIKQRTGCPFLKEASLKFLIRSFFPIYMCVFISWSWALLKLIYMYECIYVC